MGKRNRPLPSPSAPPVLRLRITFAKTDLMRFTGHLDLHHTWERTFRRARLPLAYSQGFNPHPKLNLASALPLGFTGRQEVIDAWLEDDLPLEQVHTALAEASPPGIQIAQVERVEDRQPALQSVLVASEFTVTFLDPAPGLDDRVEAVLAAESLPRERRGKPYDLRPLIEALHCLPDDEQGRRRVFVRLAAREGATGRPEAVIEELGAVPEAARVHRTRLVFQ